MGPDALLNFGVAGTVLAVLLGGAWAMAKWIAAKVVEPLVSSHLSLIESIKESIKSIRETNKEQTEAITNLEKRIGGFASQLMKDREKNLTEIAESFNGGKRG